MRAEYTTPVSPTYCAHCCDRYNNCDCVACEEARRSVVDVLALGVGANADRANICFDNGRLRSVELRTLRVLKMNKNTQKEQEGGNT